MKRTYRFKNSLACSLAAASVVSLSACTGQLPGSFRLQQQLETFDAQSKIDINTKIDLLWVVDNSASMDVSQEKLREGFSAFARKYMQPTWDIRIAVITTDTYLANPAFSSFLATVIPGSVNYQSPYINTRLSSWVNPSSNPNLLNTSNGRFPNGVKYSDLWPLAGPSYATLTAGYHDGPTPALCFEGHPYFIKGVTQCKIRDDQTIYNGVSKCLNPNTGAGETSLTQCVNTVQNNSVRSGKSIISTQPPAGVAGDSAWVDQLISDFTINVTTGSAGHGSERGLASIQQLLTDNETGSNAFFRAGSLRGIIFVTDEDDQSLAIPSTPPSGFTPWTGYTNTCTAKTVDGYTYTLTTCPVSANLIPVSDIKNQIDQFFVNLDGSGATNPNYFSVAIIPTTGTAVQQLQAARQTDDAATGNTGNVSVDRGDRYLEFGNLVGNGSLAMNIADSDYSPILDAIGSAIIEKKSSFQLARAPTAQEDMILGIQHADGSVTVIPYDKYTISGSTIRILDYNIVLGFSSTDKIVISYQPKTAY